MPAHGAAGLVAKPGIACRHVGASLAGGKIHPLNLERLHEAPGAGIVASVGRPAHRPEPAEFAQLLPARITGVRAGELCRIEPLPVIGPAARVGRVASFSKAAMRPRADTQKWRPRTEVAARDCRVRRIPWPQRTNFGFLDSQTRRRRPSIATPLWFRAQSAFPQIRSIVRGGSLSTAGPHDALLDPTRSTGCGFGLATRAGKQGPQACLGMRPGRVGATRPTRRHSRLLTQQGGRGALPDGQIHSLLYLRNFRLTTLANSAWKSSALIFAKVFASPASNGTITGNVV